MNDLLPISSDLFASVERKREMDTLLESKGHFVLEHWRDGTLLETIPFPNGATDVGKQYMLGATFNGTTPITTWYFGLLDGTSGTPTLASGDTMASHPGWTEFVTYDEGNRQTWVKAINTLNNTMASSAAAQFTVSNAVSNPAYIAGGFLTSSSTRGGTAGTLWAHGLFPNPVPVQAGDVFKINYVTGL